MSHETYLKQQLSPLGIYDLEGKIGGAELYALGQEMDTVMARLEEIQREMNLDTAQDWGISETAKLFQNRPVTDDNHALAQALLALMRIGDGSFTLQAINETIGGCGINAKVLETAMPGQVQVIFPNVAGVPAQFERIRPIIESILPAHVGIEYFFWFTTWSALEANGCAWSTVETQTLSWGEFEVAYV